MTGNSPVGLIWNRKCTTIREETPVFLSYVRPTSARVAGWKLHQRLSCCGDSFCSWLTNHQHSGAFFVRFAILQRALSVSFIHISDGGNLRFPSV